MRCLLVGNPNAGKTTLFNALTGEYQRVGNWAGVTVADKKGAFQLDDKCIEIIDLPGMYALDTASAQQKDEQLALKVLNTEDYDCLVNVIDASQLERHLYLTSQLLELNRPMLIVLTMMDKARRCGIQIDTHTLSQRLGCAVVDASREAGCSALIKTLQIPQKTPKPLLISPQAGTGKDEELLALDARYAAVHTLVLQVETRKAAKKEQFTATLDKFLLHRALAFPIFLGVMYSLFFLVISVGGFFQDSVMAFFETVFVERGGVFLHQWGCTEAFITWLTQGLGLGLATTVSFVPIMGVMFLLLACLEESGYMARVAFVMDRFMRFLGLPGKAFVPLIIGFGCNVPAVMAARTLDSERDRKITILMSPFMSCSARLTIYTVFVTAFFPHAGYNIVFSLYFLGIVMAILTGLLLRRSLFTGPISPLLLELPVYHMPVFRMLLLITLRKLRAFLWRAGRLIVPICMVLATLNAIYISQHHSILSIFGQFLQPLFAPMGISSDNWPAVVGLITGMFAKEVVIGSLNSMYASLGGLSQMFDGALSAYAYLVFVLLYVPCASTVAVIREEAGRRLMWLSVAWSLLLAYGTAVLIYQLGTVQQHMEQSLAWGVGIVALFGAAFFLIRTSVLSGGPRAFRAS